MTVGVVPAAAYHDRARLFETLARAVDVQIEPRDPGQLRDLEGVIVFGQHGIPVPPGMPRLEVPARADGGGELEIRFTSSLLLPDLLTGSRTARGSSIGG